MTLRARISAGLFAAILAGLLGQTFAAVAWFSGNGTRSISGVVTRDPGGARLRGVCVTAYEGHRDPTVNTPVGASKFNPEAITNAKGEYKIERLAPGVYRLAFRSCSDPASVVTEWWNNASTYETADDLRVPVDEDRTGINASIWAP